MVAVVRELNITESTNHPGPKHFGGSNAEELKKINQLEKQNLMSKNLLAEAELEKALLKQLANGNF